MRINSYTCSVLLNGLCKKGKVDKAEDVSMKLMEYGFVLDSK